MEPRRTQLCMLSDMLSSCLTLIVKHCNASTYKLPLPQIRANRSEQTSSDLRGLRDGDRAKWKARMTLDGVLFARAGWLARMLSCLTWSYCECGQPVVLWRGFPSDSRELIRRYS